MEEHADSSDETTYRVHATDVPEAVHRDKDTMREINILDIVTLLSALGCGLIGGVFFAFSTVVMKALGNLPPTQGLMAMQSINTVVLNPWFLTPFFGTAAACACLVIASVLHWSDVRALFWLIGGVLYLVGTLLVTTVFSVPRNNALAAVVPTSSEAARLWTAYVSSWTAWNHVRTIASLGAAVALTVALSSVRP